MNPTDNKVYKYYEDLAESYDTDRFNHSYGQYIHKQEFQVLNKLLKKPIEKNGFKKVRGLVSGELKYVYVGGLCQLTGIIFYISLIARLDIVERHHHSIDIYKEDESYTPMGTDAAIVYGYKDLRIRNNYSFPIYFKFIIKDEELICDGIARKRSISAI